MLRVQRIDERLRALEKPKLEPLEEVFVDEHDALILCAGFEDRAIEALKRAVSSGCSGFRAVVVEYCPYIEVNRLAEVQDVCAAATADVVCVAYDRENPVGIGEVLLEALGQTDGRVFLDVSGMSRLLIVQALAAFGKSSRGFARTSVVYAEALEYPPSQEEVAQVIAHRRADTIYETMFLSSGVFGVTIVPELSSVALQGQPFRLVAFPSFNVDQLVALRLELQPSYYTLIHGRPHLDENAWRLEPIRELNRTDKIQWREDVEASTLEYRETLECILGVYAAYGASERLIIAPTGSKMQAVAVGLFRSFMDDVQIAYPTPRTFARPEHYTRGVLQIWSLSLDVFSTLHAALKEPSD